MCCVAKLCGEQDSKDTRMLFMWASHASLWDFQPNMVLKATELISIKILSYIVPTKNTSAVKKVVGTWKKAVLNPWSYSVV